MENHELTPGPRCSVNIEQSKAVSHGGENSVRETA